MAKRKKTPSIPRIFQYVTRIGILAFITYVTIVHQLDKSGTPNIHAFCPFGGLEALYKLLVSGEYIPKLFPSVVILLGGTVLLTIVLNRAFCGWICPLGTLQAIMDKIARFFKIKRVQVPASVDRYLSYIKYLILLIFCQRRKRLRWIIDGLKFAQLCFGKQTWLDDHRQNDKTLVLCRVEQFRQLFIGDEIGCQEIRADKQDCSI